ncbi:MAG TPA: ammonium transporter [Tepidisphaeraceae bacterium]|nr:ammonium transporter [Tepidisphaeraceae bacterium]
MFAPPFKSLRTLLPAAAALLAAPALALAQDAAAAAAAAAPAPTVADALAKVADMQVVANTVWVLIAGMLVFFMNLGFCTLEAGLCRRKNAVNILAKNFIVFGISAIAFWVAGFGMMFGGAPDAEGKIAVTKWVGMTGFLPSLMPGTADLYPGLSWAAVPESVKFFFQLVFAGTAATIVSGAVAERVKFGMFMIFSFLLVMIVYPVTGHWIWGGGWLATLSTPFHDFAGSTVVHSVGGWAALAGVIMLGARIGKYNKDGSVTPIPGHSMALAAIGCFVLWLGWFGFNPGSTMTANLQIGHIAITTNTAAAFGSVAATVTAWLVLGKPDFSMILNGCLAGLVAVTAPCAVVTIPAAAAIGAIAGALVVFSVLFFDKVKLDDPVGALSVHLVGGTFGTICVALFASPDVIKAYAMEAYCKPGLFYGGGTAQLVSQLIGIAVVGVTAFSASMIFWGVLKVAFGIRVSAEEEIEGLDIGEHGMEAYPGFAGDPIGGTPVPTPPGTSSASPVPAGYPATA